MTELKKLIKLESIKIAVCLSIFLSMNLYAQSNLNGATNTVSYSSYMEAIRDLIPEMKIGVRQP